MDGGLINFNDYIPSNLAGFLFTCKNINREMNIQPVIVANKLYTV